jgi:hypothetical protein
MILVFVKDTCGSFSIVHDLIITDFDVLTFGLCTDILVGKKRNAAT